jgi:hypothetical protein
MREGYAEVVVPFGVRWIELRRALEMRQRLGIRFLLEQ